MTMTINTDELEKIKKIETFLKDLDIEYDKKEEVELNSDFAVKIVMDEEKILSENIYNLDDIYNEIDDIAEQSNMIKVDKYIYISKNNSPSDLGVFVWNNLEECIWFMQNVKEWIWIDKEDGIQDILKYIEERDYEKIS